ncbi:MAG: DUF2024 family protein [Methylococcales bacterium]|nr:DUF2024 family protein [Methylococcales bacterium]
MSVAHVYDTYAKTQKGKTLHFDVVLDQKDPDLALRHAREWLASIGEADAEVDLRTCMFCHSAEAPPDLRQEIDRKGYGIIKMEGCPR